MGWSQPHVPLPRAFSPVISERLQAMPDSPPHCKMDLTMVLTSKMKAEG